jgi:hypothetical protein
LVELRNPVCCRDPFGCREPFLTWVLTGFGLWLGRKGEKLRKRYPRRSTVAFRTPALEKIRTIRAIDVIANVVINNTHAPYDPDMLIAAGAVFHSFVE